MPLLSFEEQSARDARAMVASATAPGVRSVDYFTQGADKTGEPTKTVYARVRFFGEMRRPSQDGRKQYTKMTAFICKNGSAGSIDTVDTLGFLRYSDVLYKIRAVEDGDSCWHVHADIGDRVDQTSSGDGFRGGRDY